MKENETQLEIPYKYLVQKELFVPGMEGYLWYDQKGHLWMGKELRLVDVVEKYGTPLKIFDFNIVETRCRQWPEIVKKVAEKVGYKGGFEFSYATKANHMVEMVETAVENGWSIETSSEQDLINLNWAFDNKIIPRNTTIICNGFKLPPQLFGSPSMANGIKSTAVFETDPHKYDYTDIVSYADYISLLRSTGANIVPILDQGELNFFAQRDEIPPMEVGLRMKFGPVNNDIDLENFVSRHGMSWERIVQNAKRIDKIPHLKLTVLHAMVAAAEIIPPEKFARCLTFAAKKYFELKKDHPELNCLDTGGGIPPLSSGYDHEKMLTLFLSNVKQMAQEKELPEPKIIFELGSFVAGDAGMILFKVMQFKQNDPNTKWAIIDGGLMASIPDMLMTGKTFEILAANNGNEPAEKVILGDRTCDHNGIYPTLEMIKRGITGVLVPKTDMSRDWPLVIVINETGAYQDALGGESGAQHCLLPGKAIMTYKRGKDGLMHARVFPRQSSEQLREIYGYHPKTK